MKRVNMHHSVVYVLLLAWTAPTFSALECPPFRMHLHRRSSFITKSLSALLIQPAGAAAIAFDNSNRRFKSSDGKSPLASSTSYDNSSNVEKITVVYQPLYVNVSGVQIPVASWYHSREESKTTATQPLDSYQHRISLQKIGRKLAGWDFIPSFANRNFALRPASQNSNIRVVTVRDEQRWKGQLQQLPSSTPVVILAHGYLGSRFDLYHLAEKLASEGFLVLSPEYPESLADSFDPIILDTASGKILRNIDREMITNQLLLTLQQTWKVSPTSFGIVGHSLGCGTAERTGNDNWTRVCLAGFPSSRGNGSNCLFIGSMNDGAVNVDRALGMLRDYNYVNLEERKIRSMISRQQCPTIPSKSYLIFAENGAPNHISFLSEETNDAMVDFLSPLLPLARVLNIPVLDFDKYQLARDSRVCGDVVVPLVAGYLKQTMKVY